MQKVAQNTYQAMSTGTDELTVGGALCASCACNGRKVLVSFYVFVGWNVYDWIGLDF